MNIYLFNIFIVLVVYLLSPKISGRSIYNRYGKNKKSQLSIFVIFFTMFLEMGLRGDFYIDTIHYYDKFMETGRENFNEVMHGTKDIGFDVVNYLFYQYISNQYIYYSLFIAFVISLCFSIFMYRESLMIWLSFLVLLCSGSFYSGFNIVKEMLVVSIFSLSYCFVFKRKFVKYIACVLALSTIHTSALLMIPVYFLPVIKWKNLNLKWVLIVLLLASVVANRIMTVVIQYVAGSLFEHFTRDGAFGMDEGISLQGTLKAVVLSLFVIVNLNKFDKKSVKEMFIYYGCIMYAFFAVCGFQVYMIQRFVHYFTPCLMIGYPIVISRIRDVSRRRMVLILIVIVLILSSINIIIDPPYYFYWDNAIIKW